MTGATTSCRGKKPAAQKEKKSANAKSYAKYMQRKYMPQYQKWDAKIGQAKMSFQGQGKKEASKRYLHEEGNNHKGMEV